MGDRAGGAFEDIAIITCGDGLCRALAEIVGNGGTAAPILAHTPSQRGAKLVLTNVAQRISRPMWYPLSGLPTPSHSFSLLRSRSDSAQPAMASLAAAGADRAIHLRLSSDVVQLRDLVHAWLLAGITVTSLAGMEGASAFATTVGDWCMRNGWLAHRVEDVARTFFCDRKTLWRRVDMELGDSCASLLRLGRLVFARTLREKGVSLAKIARILQYESAAGVGNLLSRGVPQNVNTCPTECMRESRGDAMDSKGCQPAAVTTDAEKKARVTARRPTA